MTEFDTRLVHGRSQHDNQTGAVNVPIYNSSTFIFPKVDAKVTWTTPVPVIRPETIWKIS